MSNEETLSIEVEPAERGEFIYLPVDDLRPREYRNVPFASSGDEEAEIRANVKVGLKKSASEQTAGLYQSFGGRYTHFADKSSRLFESVHLGELKQSNGETRFMIDAELSEATARTSRDQESRLPLASWKGDFDYNSPLTKPILTFYKNAAEPYIQQNYDRMPEWLLSAYSSEENSDLDESDFSEQKTKVVDMSETKPDNVKAREKAGRYSYTSYRKYPERDTLVAIIKLHGYLRIRVDDPSQYIKNIFESLHQLEKNEEEEADNESRSTYNKFHANIEMLTNDRAKEFVIAYDYYFDNHYPENEDSYVEAPKTVTVDEAPNLVEWRWWTEDDYPQYRTHLREPLGLELEDIDSETGAGQVIHGIVKSADEDYEEGVERLDALEGWQVPRYLETLRRKASVSTEDLDEEESIVDYLGLEPHESDVTDEKSEDQEREAGKSTNTSNETNDGPTKADEIQDTPDTSQADKQGLHEEGTLNSSDASIGEQGELSEAFETAQSSDPDQNDTNLSDQLPDKVIAAVARAIPEEDSIDTVEELAFILLDDQLTEDILLEELFSDEAVAVVESTAQEVSLGSVEDILLILDEKNLTPAVSQGFENAQSESGGS